MRKLLPLLLCALLAVGLTYPVSAQETGSVVDEAANDPELTTLVAALTASGLLETLNGAGPYTLFAPTDAAFAALLTGMDVTVEELFADTDLLHDLLLYHVVAGELPSSQLLATTNLTALDEAEIAVASVNGNVVLNGSVTVSRADIPARNGVIHVIDQVLLPAVVAPMPTMAPLTGAAYVRVAHLSSDMPDVDIYIDGALRGQASLSAGQVSDWAALPPSTYAFSFVPQGALVDEAFFGPVPLTIPDGTWTTVAVLGSAAAETIQIALLDQNIDEPLAPGNARLTFFNAVEGYGPASISLADDLVLFEDVGWGEYAALDVPVGVYDVTLSNLTAPDPRPAGLPETLLEEGGYYFLTAAGQASAPTLAINAVTGTDVKAISAGSVTPSVTADGLAAPADDIIDTLAADGRFTELLAAIDAAALAPTLREAGPYTLFAPTDDAFAALPPGMAHTLLANPTALANVLLYHVVVGDVSFTETMAGAPLTALGTPLPIDASGPEPIINGEARLVDADILASNGRIHVIGSVLLPPT